MRLICAYSRPDCMRMSIKLYNSFVPLKPPWPTQGVSALGFRQSLGLHLNASRAYALKGLEALCLSQSAGKACWF